MNPHLPLTSSEDGSAFMVRGEYKTDRSRHIMDSYDTQHANWGATHRNAWKAVSERPWMAGCFYWTGFDYHGEPTPFQWPSVSSFFGIMDLCGFPKMAYYLHQAQWVDSKPVLELVPHWNWPADSIGKPIKVMALSNADVVRLSLNGKLVSEQKVDPYDMNTWMVPYKPGKLEAVGYKDGKVVSRCSVETTKDPVRVRMTPYRKFLKGDGSDAMPVTVEVLDAKGRHVPTANDMVEFSVSGPARIIGLGNGNPNSHEPEKGNRRSLFNGLTQVIIQSTGGPGKIRLTAVADGLKSAALTIPVAEAQPVPAVPVIGPSLQLDKWVLSPAYENKPDVAQSIADNDMNSWQPVAINTAMGLKKNCYLIIRTQFSPHESQKKNGGVIELRKVQGKAEVWLNGSCIGVKDKEAKDDFYVQFPPVSGDCELRVLLKNETANSVFVQGGIKVSSK